MFVDKEAAELFKCDNGEPEGRDSETAANHRRSGRREHKAEERAIGCGSSAIASSIFAYCYISAFISGLGENASHWTTREAKF